MDLSQFVDVDEFCQRTGYHRTTVYRWIERGALDSKVIFFRRLIPISEIERVQAGGSPSDKRRKK